MDQGGESGMRGTIRETRVETKRRWAEAAVLPRIGEEREDNLGVSKGRKA